MISLENCKLCPRNCGVNRSKRVGFCGAKDKMVVARAALHFYEEPVISGINGSGAIFFSYCNLKCIFCQNYEISWEHIGKEISVKKFSDICIRLQNEGAHNINLVTPTHFIPLVKEGLILAKKKGLSIPVVYNCSGYENVEALKMLDGLIDIYMPDFKYWDDDIAFKYSKCNDYKKYAIDAICEMYRQVGKFTLDNNGLMLKGVIVRHLLLPKRKDDAKRIVEYLYNTYGDNIFISIMNQYTPIKKLEFDELNHSVFDDEYDEVINFACDLGVSNAFIQEGGTQKKSFIPDFKDQKF